ncbi:hypothetical protein PROFUN_04403 [Planoprotostelium fungivorum]|uniref:Uncharacterized protein n=1 Tax=Planoprotostelium fungivorum TaxID=1890364 RepID=A0A2P6NHW3_9EUKA|nr:hypothetical protein PROFUN_04403 [Planoprotostelium fungivorum]
MNRLAKLLRGNFGKQETQLPLNGPRSSALWSLIVARIVDISFRNFEESSSKLCVTLLQEVLRPILIWSDTRHHLTEIPSKRFNDQDEAVRISAVHLLAPLDTHSPHGESTTVWIAGNALGRYPWQCAEGRYHVLSEMMAEGRVREAVRINGRASFNGNLGRYVEPLLKKTQEK